MRLFRLLLRPLLPPFAVRLFFSMVASDGGPAAAMAVPVTQEFDIVASYHRLLAQDPDLTKPIAAIEALIEALRHTPSSTAMETYEISEAQVQKLHAAVPNSLPIEAGTRMFTGFLSMSMRQPPPDNLGLSTATLSRDGRLDSFDKIRQHLLDNSQLFVQRAKEARHRIAERGSRLVAPGDVVLTTGGSRAVTELLLKAADRLEGEGAPPPVVLYVVDDRARAESARHMAALREHGLVVVEIDPSAVAYALEAYGVRSVFVGSEAVTHDGKLVSRIGTYQLALLADVAKPRRNFYVLAETHKFVRKLLLNNADLARINIQQGFFAPDGTAPTPIAPRPKSLAPRKPLLPIESMVDVTPPSLVTNFITENGILQPSGSYRIVSY